MESIKKYKVDIKGKPINKVLSDLDNEILKSRIVSLEKKIDILIHAIEIHETVLRQINRGD